MRSVTIEIPMMPPRECGPNARGHWRTKAKEAREYRTTAQWATAAVFWADPGAWEGLGVGGAVVMDVAVEWCCGRRTMDTDNLVAAVKPARDGIADIGFAGEDRAFEIGAVTQTRGAGITRITLRGAE